MASGSHSPTVDVRVNESQRPVERFANWIDSLPSWAQPTVYGACFILLLMGFRGAAFVLPVLILVVLIASDTPVLDIAKILGVISLALVGGGLSGAFYSLLGRHARRVMLVGSYLAGLLTVVPYLVVVILIVRMLDGDAVFAPVGRAEVIVLAIATGIFGPVIGHMFFRDS